MGYGVQYYLMVILHKQTLIRRNILDKCQYDRIIFHIQILILTVRSFYYNGKDLFLSKLRYYTFLAFILL